MSKRRVTAPEIRPGQRVQGPASYFPSIERKYDRPMQEWLDLVADELETHSHMEVVQWLKTQHGMGHGHANAIVAYVKSVLQD